MLNISIKERPIYKIFCYISMAYIVGATLWVLWISKFMAFAIIPVSGILIYIILLYSKHIYFVSEFNSNKNKKTEKWLLLFLYMSAYINELMNPYNLNVHIFCFYYAMVFFIWGGIVSFNDITYSTRINAMSTFFKKNTAKKELVFKTLCVGIILFIFGKIYGFIDISRLQKNSFECAFLVVAGGGFFIF